MSGVSTDHAAPLVERPSSYNELLARQRFMAPLDHRAHSLKQVLTDYHFSQTAPCGLSSCRQPHLHGYLVVTEGGAETNVGGYCGKRHFGDEVFSSARADWERRRNREDLVRRARYIQSIAADVERAIQELAFGDFGAKWVARVRRTMVDLLGADIVESLATASYRGELSVTKARRRTGEEIENAIALTPGLSRDRALYEDVLVGHLAPMPWLHFDFREELMVKLSDPLKKFAALSPENLQTPKLKKAVKQFEGWEVVLKEARDAASAALRFLSRENLQLVSQWVPEHSSAKAVGLSNWIDGKQHFELLTGKSK